MALVRQAGIRATALAIPDFKAAEAGPREAARQLGVALILIDAPALAAAQPRCVTRSSRVEQITGFASVAEASALAAAGPGGRLLRARIAGPRATCALAERS